LIAALLGEDLARRKALEADRLAWHRPRFDSPAALRRVRIVNALFIAMAHAGCQASVSNKDLDKIGFRVGDTFMEVGIESSRRVPHAGARSRAVPEDRITLNAKGWPPISGVPSSWSDGDAGLLEARILEIARDLIVMAELVYRAAVRERYKWQLERVQKLGAGARAARERIERERRRSDSTAMKRNGTSGCSGRQRTGAMPTRYAHL
jgi:hypothetical protein